MSQDSKYETVGAGADSAAEWQPPAPGGGWGAPQGPPYPKRWWALATVVFATVMDLLDSLVTNIAGPSIQRGLGGGLDLIQWLGAGYTLALACGLIIGGRLGDIYGRRRVFLIGIIGFTIASALCGLAQDPGMLLVFRVLQGLFGAAMLPQGMGMIKEIFPPKEMPAAFGVLGPTIGLATIGGPILGGVLISADIFGTGWRMIFLINVPLGALAAWGAYRFMPHRQNSSAARLDVTGTVIVAVAALLLVYPIVQGRVAGWPAWTFVSMAAGLVTLGLFAKYEQHVAAHDRDPLVLPSLFHKRSFTGGLAAGLCLFTSVTGFSLVLSVFLQIGLGYSPLAAGLTTLPQAIGSLVGFLIARAGATAKLGRDLIHVGTGVMLVGVAVLWITLHAAGASVAAWQLAPGLALMGAGMALAMAPFYTIFVAGVDPEETGSASGTVTALQQLGGAVGVAVMGTVFFAFAGTLVPGGKTGDAARGGFVNTAEHTLPVTAAILVLAAALTLLLPRRARQTWGGGGGGGGSADTSDSAASTDSHRAQVSAPS